MFGNLGVACTALITSYLIDSIWWRSAFVWPGVVSVAVGITYTVFVYLSRDAVAEKVQGDAVVTPDTLTIDRHIRGRVFAVVFFSTAIGELIFQSNTFTLPKMFDDRLADLAISAEVVGRYAFAVFAFAAVGQLVVGYLLNRYSDRTVFAMVALLQAVLFGVMPGLSGLIVLVVATAFMLVVFGQIPIKDVLISRVTQNEWRSRVYALKYIVTFLFQLPPCPSSLGYILAGGSTTYSDCCRSRRPSSLFRPCCFHKHCQASGVDKTAPTPQTSDVNTIRYNYRFRLAGLKNV